MIRDLTSLTRRVASDGLELAVETSGEGPPLIYAHGLSGNRSHTLRELQPLSRTYRVIAFDQRGHGDSTPVTEPELFAPDRMADDIGAVLDDLGIERAALGGESMGAATALLFAERHPERVESLFLAAPAFGRAVNAVRERWTAIALEIERHGMATFLARSAERMRTQFGAPADVTAYIGRMHGVHDPRSLAAAFRTVSAWTIRPDLSALARSAPPSWVLAWDGDPSHPLALAREIAGLLPGSRFAALPDPLCVFSDPPIVGRTFRALMDAPS